MVHSSANEHGMTKAATEVLLTTGYISFRIMTTTPLRYKDNATTPLRSSARTKRRK